MVAPSWLVNGADGPKDGLLGVWVAQSMEAREQKVPEEVVKRMRFTFKADKLLIRGNFGDERDEECSYKIDPRSSPMHLDFIPPKEEKPVLAVYEVKGDELRVCLRHASGSGGRPKEFKTKADSKLVLIVFKRQRP